MALFGSVCQLKNCGFGNQCHKLNFSDNCFTLFKRILLSWQLPPQISQSLSPLPDDHVAVGTHGSSHPSRKMFCHLDQRVLILRVGLRHRSGRYRTPRDRIGITLHSKRRGDQSLACRRMRHERLCENTG